MTREEWRYERFQRGLRFVAQRHKKDEIKRWETCLDDPFPLLGEYSRLVQMAVKKLNLGRASNARANYTVARAPEVIAPMLLVALLQTRGYRW